MSQIPPASGRGRLPVFALVAEAWQLVFQRLNDFAFLGASAALALCGLTLLRAIVAGGQPSSVWLLGEQLLWSFLWSSVGVSWHRFVLLGERNKTRWGELPFGAREARFFLYFIATRAPGVAVLLLMTRGDPEQVGGVVFLCGTAQIVLYMLFPLVFPATALDRDRGFGEAARLLRGSMFQLFAASILAAIPAILVVLLMMTIAGASDGVIGMVLFAPLEVASGLAVEGIVAVVVALAYRRLTGQGAALAPT